MNAEDLENVVGGYKIKGDYKCYKCREIFGSQADLDWHYEQEHSSGYNK